MATAQLGAVGRHIRDLVADQKMIGQTDGTLLRAFLDRNDQPAFEALILRHGAMVLRACLRALGNVHDAEDVLQATFLFLARQAASICKRESLASWLHGVAYRMATNARRAAARRRGHESRSNTTQPRDPALIAAWQELQLLLDEEIAGLTETLRDPFIACCLENKSCAEAARHLGLEEATVWKRLSRARKQLQERLTRRGVSLTAVLGMSAVAANDCSAMVSRSLVNSTISAAAQIAAGKTLAAGLVPAAVLSLLKGANRAMLLTKLKTAAVALMAVALAGTGTGVLTYRTVTAGQPGRAPDAPMSTTATASDAEQIGQLVEQLGSKTFADREKASKEPETVGAPGLDALRKAVQGDDAERKKRAEDLIQKIEGRDLEARLLSPKRVKLVFKDTPLPDAITEFQKQSGYQFTVSDPQRLLQGRLVTLDTGDVTFWQAFDQFCESANLVGSGLPRAGDGIPRLGEAGAEHKVAGGGGEVKPRAIVLSDGEPPRVPTDARTSFRVRVRERDKESKVTAEGVVLLALEVTAEPGISKYQILSLQVKKAVNDQDQSLEQVEQVPGKAQVDAPHLSRSTATPGVDYVIALAEPKNATKPSKSLKEITGKIRVQVTTGTQPDAKRVELDVPFTLTNVPMQ
jgi:RNA polymerase sigma factor (sigma-70 family)